MSSGIDSMSTTTDPMMMPSVVVESRGKDSIDDLRLPSGSVAGELFRKPWKFDFFQAVSLLHEFASRCKKSPSSRVGEFCPPSEESVRFTVPHTTAFPTAATSSIDWVADEQRVSMQVNFLGLTGPSGVLPEPYNDRLRDISRTAKHSQRNALRDWLDNFNHRLISLFYSAWTKYRFPIKTRKDLGNDSDHKTEPAGIRVALAAVAGLDRSIVDHCGDTHPSQRIDRDEWLAMAGLLAQRPMNAANLTAALKQCLGVDIRIHQFQGCWLELETPTQLRLGVENHQLGSSAVLGDRVWTRQQRILIEVGPLSADEFARFLPPSESHLADGYLRLRKLVEVFVGPSLEFDIRPILKIDRPLEALLTAAPLGNRLGIDSWIGSPVGKGSADDAVFAGRSESAA